MHSDGATVGSAEFARGADVIFHVAAAENAAGVHIFEARENFGGWAANDVNHYIQAAAVAHGEDGLLCVVF
jgi:hypothetical protein